MYEWMCLYENGPRNPTEQRDTSMESLMCISRRMRTLAHSHTRTYNM